MCPAAVITPQGHTVPPGTPTCLHRPEAAHSRKLQPSNDPAPVDHPNGGGPDLRVGLEHLAVSHLPGFPPRPRLVTVLEPKTRQRQPRRSSASEVLRATMSWCVTNPHSLYLSWYHVTRIFCDHADLTPTTRHSHSSSPRVFGASR